MKKVIVIINPTSGKRINNKPYEIRDLLTTKRIDHLFYLTEINHNARDLVLELKEEPKVIIVGGGDGTVSEVIQGMHTKSFKCPILIIPAGTSNELASNFKLINSIDTIEERIKKPTIKAIDYGLINHNSTFAYSLSFGTFTELTYKTPQKLKNIFGFFAYILYGFFTFRKINSHHLRIHYNEHIIEGDFTFGGITNSKTIGNVIDLRDQNPLLDDGFFEVLLIRTPETPKEYRRILKGLKSKNYTDNSFLHFKTDSISFESDKQVNWNIDGENGGDFTAVDVENIKQGIKILL